MKHRAFFVTTFAAASVVIATLAPAARAQVTGRDILIKGPDKGSAVYYLANDGKRYVFPNEPAYRSWFKDFNGVQTVALADLYEFQIGGNITYRPGIRMVKITTDPKVYAVDKGGVLRWVSSEAVAIALYGTDWNKKIDDIPDAFFFSYLIGPTIKSAADFNPHTVAATVATINADRGLPVSANPRRADTLPAAPGVLPAQGTASITSFVITGLSGAVGLINESDRTIRMTVPFGTDLKTLVPRIGHTGTSVSPASEVRQDFSSKVTYRVTAADGTVRSYDVMIDEEEQSTRKSITHFSFINLSESSGRIDEEDRTIAVEVPDGVSLRSLAPEIRHSGVSISPASGSARSFTSPVTYRVTAEDGTSRTYTVTVTVAPPQDANSITSFEFENLAEGDIDEDDRTITVTVPNGTSLSSLRPTIEHEGESISPSSGTSRSFSSPVTYTVTARDGSRRAYVVTVNESPYSSAKRITAFSFPSLAGATGDINESDKTIEVTVPYGTSLRSLTPSITHTGEAISPASGSTRSFSSAVTYTVTAEDGSTQAYRVTVSVGSSRTAKQITSFRFNNLSGAVGVIDESARTIAVTVPHGTDRSSLVPTVEFVGESINPVSGAARNFTSPVTYRVYAEDGTNRSYSVTVSVAP